MQMLVSCAYLSYRKELRPESLPAAYYFYSLAVLTFLFIQRSG